MQIIPGRVLPRDMDARQWGEFLTRLLLGVPRYDRTDSERTAGVTIVDYSYPPGDVRRYGAVGDGSTDDTAAVNTALASGHNYVVGHSDDTYLLSHVSTFTVNSVAYRRCLTIPSGVTFDLQGATLALAASQNSSPVAMLADDAALLNGTIDGNQANQTSPAAGDVGNVIAYDVDRIRVEGITSTGSRMYAGRFLNVRSSRFARLNCRDSYGDGWSFGTTGAVTLDCTNMYAEDIRAANCTGDYAGLEGNAVIVTGSGTIRGVLGVDCAGGHKYQNTSADLIVEGSVFDGDDQTYGSANSGNKFQGTNGSSYYVSRTIASGVVSKNCYGNGLYINDVNEVEVVSYFGYNNGSGSGASGSEEYDTDINSTNGRGTILLGKLHIDTPGAIGVRLQGDGRVEFDSIYVRSPTGAAVQDAGTGRLYGRLIQATDDGSGMTFAFRSTGSSAGRIDVVSTNVAHSTSQSRVGIAAANYSFEIGEIRLGSTDVLGGVAQLTNAATSTSVACGHIWRDYVGGSADYFHPILSVQPWDTSAKALAGTFGYTVTDGSSGTGFTITHAAAGASDYVVWKVLGWKVVSQASS